MDSLKPCPRHGTAPVYDHTKCDGVRFSCNACDEDTFDDFEDAAAAWNTRSEGLPPPGGGGGGPEEYARVALGNAVEVTRLTGINWALQGALERLTRACEAADAREELAEEIDGSLLDAANKALREAALSPSNPGKEGQ